MKNLKRLGTAAVLTLVLGLHAFAGQIESPPCAPPVPGQIESPPCAGGQIAQDPATPGQIEASASAAADASAFVISLFEGLLLF